MNPRRQIEHEMCQMPCDRTVSSPTYRFGFALTNMKMLILFIILCMYVYIFELYEVLNPSHILLKLSFLKSLMSLKRNFVVCASCPLF